MVSVLIILLLIVWEETTRTKTPKVLWAVRLVAIGLLFGLYIWRLNG